MLNRLLISAETRKILGCAVDSLARGVLQALPKGVRPPVWQGRPRNALPAPFAAAAGGLCISRSYASPVVEGLKYWKPTSPGQRHRITVTRKHLWKGGPLKQLSKGLRKTGGRDNRGRIASWHRGGGARRRLRFLDMKRPATVEAGTVQRLEYDPNRTGYIALVKYEEPPPGLKAGALVKHGPGGEGTYSYILAPQGLAAGDRVSSGADAEVAPGNALPLRAIPPGTTIHNIELRPGKGGQVARSAGTQATLVKNQPDGYAVVRMPSGEMRLVLSTCKATVGSVSNPLHQNTNIGKAGHSRHRGRRPIVRGVAMNPVDHPHGGRTAGGRPSVTPWGLVTKGRRTRRNSRAAPYILTSRRKTR